MSSNPSDCAADETNVRLVSSSDGMWLGEASTRAADWLLAVPLTDLIGAGWAGLLILWRCLSKEDDDYLIVLFVKSQTPLPSASQMSRLHAIISPDGELIVPSDASLIIRVDV